MPSLLSFRSSPGVRATRRLVPTAIAFVLAALAATPAAASTVPVPHRRRPRRPGEPRRPRSGLSITTEAAENNRIYTVARLAVIEDLTGVNESVVEVRELGGRIGIDEMFIAGTPGYFVGQEVLLLLERGPRGLRTVALAFSAFHVVPEGIVGAEAGVVRFAAGLEVLGEQPESRRTRTLAEMRTIVGATKGVTPVRPAAAVEAGQTRVEQPFTLLGSSRWRQADTATTVNFYRNTDRPHPLTSGNIDTEIRPRRRHGPTRRRPA